MKSKNGATKRLLPLLLVSFITGCAISPPDERQIAPVEMPGAQPLLAYYQSLQRMPLAEMTRERTTLGSHPSGPGNQLRLAMLLGHPRGPQDLSRALSLLDGVLKSPDPAAQSLQALARLLADNTIERLKLDGQLEKQGVQLKESQRKAVELQDKLNGLADIERTLSPRARTPRLAAPVVTK